MLSRKEERAAIRWLIQVLEDRLNEAPPVKFALSRRSRKSMKGIHHHLVAVIERAIEITPVDFVVIEGLRTPERQAKLVEAGASQTHRSRHLTGHAFDVAAWVDGQVRWDWPLYEQIADAVKDAASELGVPIEWGGDWESLKDGPHFQLPWFEYPIDKAEPMRNPALIGDYMDF